MPIPDIPGDSVNDSQQLYYLKQRVATLCGLDRYRFPGSQPVSFGKKDLAKLEQQDYWVCEKSDGVRVLVFINRVENTTDVYLIDRNDHYRFVSGYYFPSHADPAIPLGDTILDGELVIDVNPATGQQETRLLLFDCLVHNEQNIMKKPLSSRYGRLKTWLFDPYMKALRKFPEMMANRPFDVQIKHMEFSYHVEKVLKEDIPKLKHGNDGLIYTCAETPYVVGTDERILKWKPPSENSIDFRLELRFPPLASDPSRPDLTAKPIFALNVWLGKDRNSKGKQAEAYEFFDVMDVDDDEWAKIKAEGTQFDDRVVEVHWEPEKGGWRFMRFRDDKPEGNYKGIVDKIIQTIVDGIEQDDLISRSGAVKSAWKTREIAQKSRQPQPQQQQQHGNLYQQRPPQQQGHTPQVAGPPRPYGPLSKPILNKVQGPDTFEGWKR
ncbi:hypothetical protein M422DRAFT_180359 [Sphaerobolus stellatus SS14]|uniref:mRNA-capping enzyme subunit alpha n=1 Tax=Sphaerobolus stellatus (strain SS14) TaxID=990650 RepID=A0A0C9V2B7_SPHS4|nr:hypothetical protein M422DRAFT_180359 [Sphaerobolus stellatus SS14]